MDSAAHENRLATLKTKVAVLRQEVETLVALHEAWRPMVSNAALRQRRGESYATNTFEVIRIALRREVLLGLARLWDKDRHAVSLENIGHSLLDRRVVEALVTESVESWGKIPLLPSDDIVPVPSELGGKNAGALTSSGREWVRKTMAGTLQRSIDDAHAVIRKYSDGGSGFVTRKHLAGLRNEWLAHRQVKPSLPSTPDSSDNEIEAFYEDMLTIVETLSHAVDKTAYNLHETARHRQQESELFWNGARGERTEGHPNYKARR